MKIRKLLVSICVIGLVFGLTACAAKMEKSSDYLAESKVEAPKSGGTDGFTSKGSAMPSVDTGSKANADQVITSQKLIKTVDLNLETLEYDDLLSFLDQKIKDFKGYVEESQSYGNSMSYSNLRSANLKVRVPSDRLDEFVHLIGENTTITRKSEDTQDVTSAYVDTESRKKSLEIQQERLFALLEKADKMEDIITLEARISEVTYQLESYTSTLRTYDNLVDYSTVIMQISEVERVSNPKPDGVFEQMKDGLSDSLYSIKEGFKSFSVWFVSSLPYLIIWALIIFVAIIVIRKLMKTYNAKYNYYGTPSNRSNANSQSNIIGSNSTNMNSTESNQNKNHLDE